MEDNSRELEEQQYNENIAQASLKEYIVTATSFEDLETLYDELETPGGSETVPDRSVECSLRRPISRNTHYLLTEDEAENLKYDDKVIDVISKDELDAIVIRPTWVQDSSYWNKSTTSTQTDKNWALLRCTEGSQRSNWGSNSTANQTGIVTTTSSGKNVDVVIIDGHINPDHPEFAVNPDGTGGSRVVPFNWFSLTAEAIGGTNGTYSYTPYTSSTSYTGSQLDIDNNHGMHVAGTVAGNTQGWARSANIYNISPYSTNPNSGASTYFLDYIRAFHREKGINLNTGIKNPTICNCSFASSYAITRSTIGSINWRGTAYAPTPSFTDAQLRSYGLVDFTSTVLYIAASIPAIAADYADAIADGILFVGAAGNESTKIDISSGVDYNNTISYSTFVRYYHRGDSKHSSTMIQVGSISQLSNESKSTFSNCGPRIDVYAPGSSIMSCVHNDSVNVNDPRNSSYKLIKKSGTSMASPQVCGVLACLLETNPRMKQAEALNYITTFSKVGQITDTGGGYTDNTSLQGSQNRYLFFYNERPKSGSIQPVNNGLRQTSGLVWPRRKFKLTPRSNPQLLKTFTYNSGTTGTQTSTASGGPISQGYRRFVSQMIYTASELTAGGVTSNAKIRNLQFYVKGLPVRSEFPDYQIQMFHTIQSDGSASASVFDGGSKTTVRSSTLYSSSLILDNWNIFAENFEFVWDGTRNICIEICWSQIPVDYSFSGTVRCNNSFTNGVRFERDDLAGSICGTTVSRIANYKPHIRMNWI